MKLWLELRTRFKVSFKLDLLNFAEIVQAARGGELLLLVGGSIGSGFGGPRASEVLSHQGREQILLRSDSVEGDER